MKPALKNQEMPSSLNVFSASRDQLKIVIVGHVDHGKSTLVGRIFHDTDSLPEGKFEQIQAMCEKRGMPFEWSFLMDALQSERDQGITIDTTQIWFKTAKRDYVIIDAPGHKEFLKNMITGAANADAALLVIDAKEGVQEQSKRHGYLLHLLGISQIAVAVNKMDMVGYDQKIFRQIEREYREYLKSVGVTPTFIVPISAREGDGVVGPSKNMPWYKGPSIIEALDAFKRPLVLADLPLRLPVQDVYKFDDRRIIAGRIESGTLKVGDRVLFSPSNKTAKVKSIETWPNPLPLREGEGGEVTSNGIPHPTPLPEGEGVPQEASAGVSVGITLDEQIFVERGQILSHEPQAPVLTNIFRAKLFWLGRQPLTIGRRYVMKLATSEHPVEVKAIERVVDTDDLNNHAAEKVERNSVAEVVLRVRGVVALDAFSQNSKSGRFVLIEDFQIGGGGIVDLQGFPNLRVAAPVKSANIFPVELQVGQEERERLNGHKGGVLWFTGLSGSGKTTIAKELQRRLFLKGCQVYVLDGDNIRRGLSADLGFSPRDRAENIRRIGEVAALFADAGMVVITSFISPYKSDRDRARAAVPAAFHGIYIKADIKTCEQRDPKGLYKKARAGEIKEFTGISAPYEEPHNPDLIVDTTRHDLDQCVALLEDYVEHHLINPVRNKYRNPSEFVAGEI